MLLDSPDFTVNPQTLDCRAGVRPYRNGTFRFEKQFIGNKTLIHNYGHGGAGITMSWGCAHKVLDMVASLPRGGPIAVLGAGVIGLTAATLLIENGFKVNLYAEKFYPDTTSSVAGGQWAPSLVNFVGNQTLYFDILRLARKEHEKRGLAYGVSQRWNYSTGRINHLDILPSDIVKSATKFSHLPFSKLNGPGWAYDILLVEPPILLKKLLLDLDANAAAFTRKQMTITSVAMLSETINVNCTGLGSKNLFNDNQMAPKKGQLAFLPAQPNLKYLYSGAGYVFPRSDAVVVGGTIEDIDNTIAERAKCITLVEHAKAVFAGSAITLASLPPWLLQNK